MIINIRGTSGSGKSTLVRAIMDLYPHRLPRHVEGRKRPLYYLLARPAPHSQTLAVIGHYETPCGGCDTITNVDQVYEEVRRQHEAGHDVLFEGLLISAEQRRTIQMHRDGLPLLVAAIDIPLEECLASVNARRAARNPELGEVNPKNTTSKWKAVRSCMRKFGAEGIQTFSGSRAVVLEHLLLDLGLVPL